MAYEYGERVYFSENGATFYELQKRGFGGTFEDNEPVHSVHFEDPHHPYKAKGKFDRKGDELTLGNEIYIKRDAPQFAEIIKLPEVREVESSFTLNDGRKLMITRDKYNFTFDTYKLLIDDSEIPIRSFDRHQDGGTTYVKTDEGTLYIPTPFDDSKQPTWNGEVVKRDE